MGIGGAAAWFGEAVLTAIEVAAGDFAGELFKELHTEGREAVKRTVEGGDGKLEERAGALRAEGEGVAGVAQGGAQLDEVAGTCRTERETGVEPDGFADKDARDDHVKALARAVLMKHDVAGIDLEGARSLIEEAAGFGGAAQDLCEGTGRGVFDGTELGFRFHDFPCPNGCARTDATLRSR